MRLPFPPRRSRTCSGPCGLRITPLRPCCPACYRLLPDELKGQWVAASLLRDSTPEAAGEVRDLIAAWFVDNPQDPAVLARGRHRATTTDSKEA